MGTLKIEKITNKELELLDKYFKKERISGIMEKN